jgi:hypothetical protein
VAKFTALCLGRCPDGSLRGERRARVERKWLMLKAAIRLTHEQGELNPQAPAVCEAETLVKVSTVFFAAWSRPQKLSTLRQ